MMKEGSSMVRIGSACFGIVIALVLVSSGQDEDLRKKLKSADAKKAVADYDRALKKAQDAFDANAEAARNKLLTELMAAQEKAAKANQLDEAVLIRDLRNGYEAGDHPSPRDGRIVVVSAFYGQNVSWLDVTGKVRLATKGKPKWSAVVRTTDWGEPAPGFAGPRTLIVRYITGGKVLFKSVYEGQEIVLP